MLTLGTNFSRVLGNILEVNAYPEVIQDESLSNLIWLLNASWRLVWWELEITVWLGKSQRTMKAGNKIQDEMQEGPWLGFSHKRKIPASFLMEIICKLVSYVFA